MFQPSFIGRVFDTSYVEEHKLSAMSKSTKNRSKRSTNISGGLQKEIQALIAYACNDLPSLIRQGGSTGESAIEDKMTSIFNGEGKNGADPNLLDHQ